MNKKKILQKILNNQKNIKYNEFVSIVEAFGFINSRTEGSHTIFKNSNVSEIINIQNVNGEAKSLSVNNNESLVSGSSMKPELPETALFGYLRISCKPYQIKQFLSLIEKYNLEMEE